MRQITEQHLGRYSIWDRITAKPLGWLAILIDLFLCVPLMMLLLFLIFTLYHPFKGFTSIYSGVCFLLFITTFLATKQFFKTDRLFLLFILLAIVSILSGILGGDPSLTLKPVIRVCFYPLFYLMVINVVDTREKVKWVMRVIILAATSQAIIGVIEFIFDVQLFSQPLVATSMDTIKIGGIERVRVSGSWDPTYFGALIVSGIPVTFLMIRLRREKVLLRVIYIIAFILLIVSLILSFSKGAMISLVGILLFGLMKIKRKRILIIFLILMGLLLGSVVLYSLDSQIATTWIGFSKGIIENINPANIDYSKPKSLSIAFRWVHWSEALKMILSHPLFGVGPENSIVLMAQQNVPPAYAGNIHNHFLLIAAEYGLLALSLYFCIIVMIWKNYLEVEKVARANQDEEMVFISIGLQASLLAYLIVFQAQPIAFNLNLGLLFALSGAIKHNILLKEKG